MKTIKIIAQYLINALAVCIICLGVLKADEYLQYRRANSELANYKYLEHIYYNVIPDDDFEDLLLRIPEEKSDDYKYIAKEWLKEQKEKD